MLGWEFPPHISGGLGTACLGLTRALSRRGVQVIFVLPRAVEGPYPEHLRLLAPRSLDLFAARREQRTAEELTGYVPVESDTDQVALANVRFRYAPAELYSSYQSAAGGYSGQPVGGSASVGASQRGLGAPGWRGQAVGYEGDLIQQVKRYAELCLELSRRERFDVIHAHDWMTFPAALAVAGASGKPLVVHVHSTEFDRSGRSGNPAVYEIERRGLHGAARVIAVSHLTRMALQRHYRLPRSKIAVVYNGIERASGSGRVLPRASLRRGDKVVLFLGRVTMQKGPEYFVEAAGKVLEKIDNVKFVVAGSGDKIVEVIELAAQRGIGHRVLFTGFLRGADVERVFRMADVYVMPSVSEPFGIASLEAVSHEVPVIVSKTSGVSEVLTHALKVDFWDTQDMADKIVAVLKHPPLSRTLREQADIEVRRLTWDDAAARCCRVYEQVAAMVPAGLDRRSAWG